MFEENLNVDCPFLYYNNYHNCYYRCVYCFVRTGKGKFAQKISLRKRKEYYFNVKKDPNTLLQYKLSLRLPVLVGTTTDPLQPIENSKKLTLDFIKKATDNNYPFIMLTKNPKKLFEYIKYYKNDFPLATRITILTPDKNKAKKLEPYAPTPQERIKYIKELSEIGAYVILAVSPFFKELEKDLYDLLEELQDYIKGIYLDIPYSFNSFTWKLTSNALGIKTKWKTYNTNILKYPLDLLQEDIEKRFNLKVSSALPTFFYKGLDKPACQYLIDIKPYNTYYPLYAFSHKYMIYKLRNEKKIDYFKLLNDNKDFLSTFKSNRRKVFRHKERYKVMTYADNLYKELIHKWSSPYEWIFSIDKKEKKVILEDGIFSIY